MLKANFITAQEAAEKIQDGSTLCTIGMTLVSASESILKAIEKRFETVGHPADITLVHSCGQSDRKDGIQHLAHEGLVKRIVGSHWGLQPRWMEMIANSQVEAYCLPQGQIAQLYRSMACGLPAAVVVMSKEKAEELGVTPKMKIEGYAIAGFDAELMGYSPKFSSEKLANKLGVDLKSIDMFEINEAFASQAYAVSRDLGLDPEKVNIYGGGISIGHPIGATGAMLTVKVMYELMRTDKKDAMISMCIGGGQGISMYFTKCE